MLARQVVPVLLAHEMSGSLRLLDYSSPGRGIELCWEASRASTQGPEWPGRQQPPRSQPFWRNSDKIPEVWRQSPESSRATESAAGRLLQQLAALDRARDSLQQLCQRLATAADHATKLYTKIQERTESFIGNWNAAHPDQRIQRCRGAESNSACLRYTTNEQRLCDACRNQRGTPADDGTSTASPLRF